jgi:undecaprenyl-phosphate galactose phosphotransferase
MSKILLAILILADTLLIYLLITIFGLEDKALFLSVILILLYYEGIYTNHYDIWQEAKKIIKALFFSTIIILSLSSFILENNLISLLKITLLMLSLAISIILEKRLLKYKLFQKFSSFKEKIHIVGDKEQKKRIEREIRENSYLGYQLQEDGYNSVIIASKGLEKRELDNLIEKFLAKGKRVYVVPYLTDINFANSDILEYTNIKLNTVKIENKLLAKSSIFLKNVIDILLLIISLPVAIILHIFVVIYFYIYRESKEGSLIFKQERLGKDGKPFKCYKYRTMREDKEENDRILKEYFKEHPEEEEYYRVYHKLRNDPRVTKVGKMLRKTSLDELPQIFNVIKQEMSFIGPRPYMVEEGKDLKESDKALILKAKPGITGLWQVSGRSELTFQERVELERWYIKNWSIWLDLIILIKTVKVVLLKAGAR